MKAQNTKPLCEFRDADDIQARLAVLMEKRRRLFAYDESVASGAPDVSLLDEKQRWILGDNRGLFPVVVHVSLGRTIDTLRSRLKRYEERLAA